MSFFFEECCGVSFFFFEECCGVFFLKRVFFLEHDQMTGCSYPTKFRSQTHKINLTSTSSQLEPDSTKIKPRKTEL